MLYKGYVPDFKKAFEHFLLHTGGRGVIDELEDNLRLTPKMAMPSKDTLCRFGNTSAASTWCGSKHQTVNFSIYIGAVNSLTVSGLSR